MSNDFLSKLIFLDFFSIPLTLNVFGKKKHRTLFGAFVSFSSIIFFAFAFQKKLVEFIDYKAIDVKQAIVQEIIPPNIEVTNQNIMFAMRFDIWNHDVLQTDTTSLPFLFKISAFSQILKKQESQIQKIDSVKNIPVVTCTAQHFTSQNGATLESISESFSQIQIESYFCPELDASYILGGDQNSPQFNYLKIDIEPCFGDSNCWTQQQIDDYISENQYFKVQIIFNSYIPNYDDPIYLKPVIYNKKYFKFIPLKMKPITEFFFTQNYINSNDSWFWFADYKKEIIVMHSEQELRESIEITSSFSQSSYGEFKFKRSSFTNSTIRDYQKIDSILSYMGGFIQMVLFAVRFIMEYYNSQNLKLRLANELYRFEEKKKFNIEEKDVHKFATRQDYLENIFEQISKKPKNLSLNLSYFIYFFSSFRFFKTSKNLLLREAMKQVRTPQRLNCELFLQVDNDLNMFEILLRLQEIDKIKQIMFSEDQRKILEYSEKPSINLESVQKNKMIQDIQKQQEKRKKKKLLQERAMKQQSFFKKIQILKNSSEIKSNISIKDDKNSQISNVTQNKNNQEQLIMRYIENEKNMIRVKKVSHLLKEEYQFYEALKNYQSKEQLQMNQIIEQVNGPIRSQNCNLHTKDHIIEQNSSTIQRISHYPPSSEENNQQISINEHENLSNKLIENKQKIQGVIKSYRGGLESPLKQFLKQSERKKNSGMLLNLIKELRPQTFYCERTDYSKFSSFYELYQICEEAILKQNLSQQEITIKIANFLKQDIKEVFKLANQLPKKEDLEKALKVDNIVKIFIHNLKEKNINLQNQLMKELKAHDESNQHIEDEKSNKNRKKIFFKKYLMQDVDSAAELFNISTQQKNNINSLKNSQSIVLSPSYEEERQSDFINMQILEKRKIPNPNPNTYTKNLFSPGRTGSEEELYDNDHVQIINQMNPLKSISQISKNPSIIFYSNTHLSQDKSDHYKLQINQSMNKRNSTSENTLELNIGRNQENDKFIIQETLRTMANYQEKQVLENKKCEK